MPLLDEAVDEGGALGREQRAADLEAADGAGEGGGVPGGIATAEDALEFLIAGATAVQVGTANFVDPFVWPKLLDGITAYLERHHVARVADLVGTVQTTRKAASEPSCSAS